MRFNTNNLSNKPPSRATSKRKKRVNINRVDSQSRMPKENRLTYSRGKGASSLARTSGKTASRIIFSDKSNTYKEHNTVKMNNYPATSLPMGTQYTDNRLTGSYKPMIGSNFDHHISKPIIGGSMYGSVAPSVTAASNFPKKILIKRDSNDESTRDETKITRSSNYSKSDPYSKFTNKPLIVQIVMPLLSKSHYFNVVK